ncbi:MAG: hypothetical protein DMG38_28270 [Acidobacteria bacterium]|nr:MAG: hypothetical protein DMG38_28270 [Acidobacteriota bacterium]
MGSVILFSVGFFLQEESVPPPAKILRDQAVRKVRQKESQLIGDLLRCTMCRSPYKSFNHPETRENGQRLAAKADNPPSTSSSPLAPTIH